MSKTLFKKELILIDFEKNEFNFYNVEILSVGFNQLQVITNYGKLGNKGKESIVRLEDLKEAYKVAYKRIFDRKELGYISRRKLSEAITAASSFIRHEEKNNDKKPQRKKNFDNNNKTKECDVCKKSIAINSYNKINNWARNEGNWDKDKNFIGYNKVLCIECQIEHDIFKKKM